MKKTMFIAVAALALGAVQAQAGHFSFGLSIGVPMPSVVVAAPAPVYYAPPPAPVYYAPPPAPVYAAPVYAPPAPVYYSAPPAYYPATRVVIGVPYGRYYYPHYYRGCR